MPYQVEDIGNMALDAIGYQKRIGDIYEGSTASRVLLEVYGQTRDALIEEGDWPFSLREVLLTAVGGQTPPTPWAYEYAYPSDCLRMRYLRPGPLTGGTENFDPQPVLFRPWNDNRPSPAIRAILCDLASAVLIYNGQVTDPSTWPPEFLKALVSALAEKMTFMLPQSPETSKAVFAIAARDKAEGMDADDIASPRTQVQVNGNQR